MMRLITPQKNKFLLECSIGPRIEHRITENKVPETAPLHIFKFGISHKCVLYYQGLCNKWRLEQLGGKKKEKKERKKN